MSVAADASILSRTLDWLKARLTRDEELDTLSPADVDLMAADVGLTVEQFRDIAPRVTDHGWQMDEMLRARGLDPDKVRHLFGGLVREMEVVCTQCRSPGRCRRELALGLAAEDMHAFCPNAAVIDELHDSGRVPL